jgi:hypothetical protein
MVAVRTSETSVDFYQTARDYIRKTVLFIATAVRTLYPHILNHHVKFSKIFSLYTLHSEYVKHLLRSETKIHM